MQRTARSFHFPSGIRLMDMFFSGWSVLVFIFLYLPIVLLVGYSFNSSRLNILWEGFTLKWYSQLWQNAPLIQALKNSLIVAVFTCVLSVALGTLGAWLLYRYRFPAKRAIQTLIFIPMVIPEIIMGISLMIFFAAIAFEFGYTTIIISHVTFCFPFVLVAIQARLSGVDPFLEEAAMDLGATPLQAFLEGDGSFHAAGDRIGDADEFHALARRIDRDLLHDEPRDSDAADQGVRHGEGGP